MKLTKSQLKQIIKEELMTEGGISLPRLAKAKWRQTSSKLRTGLESGAITREGQEQIKEIVYQILDDIARNFREKTKFHGPEGKSSDPMPAETFAEWQADDMHRVASYLNDLAEDVRRRADDTDPREEWQKRDME